MFKFSKFSSTIKLLPLVLATIFVAGCGPGVSYQFIQPETYEGRQCIVDRCLFDKGQCEGRCNNNLNNCRTTTGLTDVLQGALARNKGSGFDTPTDNTWKCNMQYNNCVGQCNYNYRSCFQLCGGSVIRIEPQQRY